MNTFKILLLALISFSLIGCALAQTKKGKTVEKSNTKTAKTNEQAANDRPIDKPANDVKVLAEGAYSKIEQPFVFAARSNETYLQLQKLVENLPLPSDIDFSKTAVVAAFAGTKNSGGYSVSIKNSAGKISIETINPPSDAMLSQAITAPFKVALVSLAENNSLNLQFSTDWKNAMRIYKVMSGAFEYSGGFAGMQKKLDVEGTIGVLSFGDYATLTFNLAGKGAEKKRALTETASGSLEKAKIQLARLDAGSFSENPKPPLKVSGTITDKKLSLVFEPLPTIVADGFQARGKIEAAKAK
jgi:hypothetical protein